MRTFGWVGGVALMVAALVGAPPAAAAGTISIAGAEWVAAGAQAGTPAVMKFYGAMTGTPRCTVRFTGPSAAKKAGVKVVDFRMKVPTTGLKSGVYRGRVSCPGSKTYALPPLAIVSRGSSPVGTCTVIDHGFTARPSEFSSGRTYVEVGFVMENSNPYVPSSSGDVIVNALDAAGNVLETDAGSFNPLPPGSTRPSGTSMTVDNGTVAAVEVTSTCSDPVTSLEFTPQMDIAANGFTGRDGSGVEGQLTNSTSDVWDSFTSIRFVTRDAAGAITGGGKKDLGTDLPPGATIRWSEVFYSVDVPISSVQAVVTPWVE